MLLYKKRITVTGGIRLSLQVVFSFEENDNPPLTDLFHTFIKIQVGRDIPYAAYHAFLQAVLKANHKYVPINTLIRIEGIHESVNLEDILYIEVTHHTIKIHCRNNKELETTGTLEKIEERLRDYGFIRTHRRYLVPVNKIRCVTRDAILLQNGCLLHIGKSYQKIIRELFQKRYP